MVERPVGAANRVVVVVVRVVDVEDVDALELQALEALVDRAHDPVVAEVEDGIDRRRALEILAGLGRRVGAEEPADLGREHELVAWFVVQRLAHAHLREPGTVQGRGVEMPDPGLPCARDHRKSLVLGHRFVKTGERRGAEAEARHLEGGPAQPGALGCVHEVTARRSPACGRCPCR